MNKNIILIIMIIFIVAITGCSNPTADNNIKNKSVKETMKDVMNGYIKYDIVCDALKQNIELISSGGIMLSSGEIFEYNKKKYSSTDTNCRSINTKDYNFITINSGGDGAESMLQFIDEEGNVYFEGLDSFVYGGSPPKNFVSKLDNFDKLYFYGAGNIFASKDDTIYIDENDKLIKIPGENIVNVNSMMYLPNGSTRISDNEYITHLYISTNKNYYMCKPQKNSNCEYVDQICDYEYICEKDENMNNLRSEFKYYDGIYLVDNSGYLYIREF